LKQKDRSLKLSVINCHQVCIYSHFRDTGP